MSHHGAVGVAGDVHARAIHGEATREVPEHVNDEPDVVHLMRACVAAAVARVPREERASQARRICHDKPLPIGDPVEAGIALEVKGRAAAGVERDHHRDWHVEHGLGRDVEQIVAQPVIVDERDVMVATSRGAISREEGPTSREHHQEDEGDQPCGAPHGWSVRSPPPQRFLEGG